MLTSRRGVVLWALGALGCGTGASPAGGDQNLPNAMAGPFRVLRAGETGSRAPFILDRNAPWEAPSVLDPDGDPSTPAAVLFVAGNNPSAISRFEVPDGRTSVGNAQKILAASEPWEGPEGVGHPAALRVGGEVWLYYASGGCIGRAVSSDGGMTFRKSAPSLCGQDGPAWEGGSLTAPSVHRGFDGKFHLLYEASGAIGEAVSADGASFTRQGEGPLLAPAPASGPLPADGGVDEPFDDAAVGEPFAMTESSPLGRPVTFVYYTGKNRLDRTAIGLAARFGDEGPLTRNPAPALSRYDARGPSILRLDSVTLLYAAGRSSEAADKFTSYIVGALAPADRSLPATSVKP